jgi:hypothetical protein
MVMMIGTSSFAVGASDTGFVASNRATGEAIVQIYGRMCEYHREDVEAAFRRFKSVQQVEFLNDHGTVLVRYETGSDTPEQFADAVEQALAAGWSCSARVDRGQSHVRTIQQKERP